MERKIMVKILRSNPKKGENPRYVEYEVPVEEGASVLKVLSYIYENIDSGLAYYCSCRIGKCKGCIMMINGKVGYACTTPVRGDVTLEPARGFEVIKDLVVNLEKKVEV
jgi:succinate dehydrogenase/fumarate reductase iron-sulfur protein